jgi:hypothetical protein
LEVIEIWKENGTEGNGRYDYDKESVYKFLNFKQGREEKYRYL